MKSFDDQMFAKDDYYLSKEIFQKIQIICREIETRNLEKQMSEDTKHIPTSKTKLLKF